jgi:hypothetical protein
LQNSPLQTFALFSSPFSFFRFTRIFNLRLLSKPACHSPRQTTRQPLLVKPLPTLPQNKQANRNFAQKNFLVLFLNGRIETCNPDRTLNKNVFLSDYNRNKAQNKKTIFAFCSILRFINKCLKNIDCTGFIDYNNAMRFGPYYPERLKCP